MPAVKNFKHAHDSFNDGLNYIEVTLRKTLLGTYPARLHYKNGLVVPYYIKRDELDKFENWVKEGLWAYYNPPICPFIE